MPRRLAGILTAIGLVVFAGSRSISGWDADGHHVIGRIALAQMSPDTKRAVQDLLGAEDFIAASTWADDIRAQRPETYNWHFVNIPYSEQSYDASRDCKPTPRGDCIIAELERSQRAMTDASLSKSDRAEALKFLIHFIGDLHQPLHTIDNHDRGGNDTFAMVAGRQGRGPGGSVTLHSVWDATPVDRTTLTETAYAATLTQDVKTQFLAALPVDFVKWAEATHQIAVEYVYDYPGFSPNGPPASPLQLSDDYRRRTRLAIEHQVELAGVRLAAVLNQAFRSSQPSQPLGSR